MRAVLANPEQAIADGNVIKKGSTNTVAIVTLSNGEQVLIKRFKSTKGFLHKYLRGLRTSRARQCWLNGFLLEMLGIATPQPYALLEKRCGPFTTPVTSFNRYHQAPQAMDWFMLSPLPEECTTDCSPNWRSAAGIAALLDPSWRSQGQQYSLVDGKPMLIDLDAMTSYKNLV